jgi:hypothetical protein
MLGSHRLTVDFLDELRRDRPCYTDFKAQDLCLKVLLCGDSQCGKSRFMSRASDYIRFDCETSYSDEGSWATLSRSCNSYSSAKNNVKLELWEIGEVPRSQNDIRRFLYSSAIVFCYSVEEVVNQGKSLRELMWHWARVVAAYVEGSRISVPVLCGMKCDRVLEPPRTKGRQAANYWNEGAFETAPTQAAGLLMDWEAFNREMELSAEAILAEAGCRCYTPVKGFVTSAKENVGLDEVLDYIERRCVGLVQDGTSMGFGRSGAVRLPSVGLLPAEKQVQHCPRCLT